MARTQRAGLWEEARPRGEPPSLCAPVRLRCCPGRGRGVLILRLPALARPGFSPPSTPSPSCAAACPAGPLDPHLPAPGVARVSPEHRRRRRLWSRSRHRRRRLKGFRAKAWGAPPELGSKPRDPARAPAYHPPQSHSISAFQGIPPHPPARQRRRHASPSSSPALRCPLPPPHPPAARATTPSPCLSASWPLCIPILSPRLFPS